MIPNISAFSKVDFIKILILNLFLINTFYPCFLSLQSNGIIYSSEQFQLFSHLPADIFLHIINYFDLEDYEYHILKEHYLAQFRATVIITQKADEALIRFYVRSLNFKNLYQISKILGQKYKKLNYDFPHYQVLLKSYNKILLEFKDLHKEYQDFHNLFKSYFFKNKFNKFKEKFNSYVDYKTLKGSSSREKKINYSNALIILYSLKTDLKLLMFKKLLRSDVLLWHIFFILLSPLCLLFYDKDLTFAISTFLFISLAATLRIKNNLYPNIYQIPVDETLLEFDKIIDNINNKIKLL